MNVAPYNVSQKFYLVECTMKLKKKCNTFFTTYDSQYASFMLQNEILQNDEFFKSISMTGLLI